jgi:hypothetical protein
MLVWEPMWHVLKKKECIFYSNHVSNNIMAGQHFTKSSLSHATTEIAEINNKCSQHPQEVAIFALICNTVSVFCTQKIK